MFNSRKDGISPGSVRLEAALSRLDALVNWEKRSRIGVGREMKVSLDPMRDLCARLGSPEAGLCCVHVAGSKGKGSTCSLVSGALRAAGVREGLYTSPHVEHVQERLRLGGREVDDERLSHGLERALAAREAACREGSAATAATWFDVLTAAALLVLREAEVEVAVIECGLGGRLDSTNVVHGRVAAVTNVYLEHTAILGTTRAAIASEKAGILEPGAQVVVGALSPGDEAAEVVERAARALGAVLTRVEHAPSASLEARNEHLAAAILAALERAEPELSARHGGFRLDAAGCSQARLPGRAERRLRGEVRVVLDGAHVPESLELLLRDLAADAELAAVPPVVVIGMGLEKSALGLLKALQGRVDRVLCSSVGAGPYRDAAELAALAGELGLESRAVTPPSAALDEAVRIAGTGGWVLVTGSLHLVGALRGHTRLQPTR